MELENALNEVCYRLISPAIKKIKYYDFEELNKIIFSLFNGYGASHTSVDLYSVIILINKDEKLFCAIINSELKKPELNNILKYNRTKINIIKLGNEGTHGWQKLIIVEGEFLT